MHDNYPYSVTRKTNAVMARMEEKGKRGRKTYFSSLAWSSSGVDGGGVAATAAAEVVTSDPLPLHPHPTHHCLHPTPPLCTNPNTFPHLALLSGGVSAPPAARLQLTTALRKG